MVVLVVLAYFMIAACVRFEWLHVGFRPHIGNVYSKPGANLWPTVRTLDTEKTCVLVGIVKKLAPWNLSFLRSKSKNVRKFWWFFQTSRKWADRTAVVGTMREPDSVLRDALIFAHFWLFPLVSIISSAPWQPTTVCFTWSGCWRAQGTFTAPYVRFYTLLSPEGIQIGSCTVTVLLKLWNFKQTYMRLWRECKESTDSAFLHVLPLHATIFLVL